MLLVAGGFSRSSPLGCGFHPQGGVQNLWMVSCTHRNRLVYALRVVRLAEWGLNPQPMIDNQKDAQNECRFTFHHLRV